MALQELQDQQAFARRLQMPKDQSMNGDLPHLARHPIINLDMGHRGIFASFKHGALARPALDEAREDHAAGLFILLQRVHGRVKIMGFDLFIDRSAGNCAGIEIEGHERVVLMRGQNACRLFDPALKPCEVRSEK